MVPPHTRISVPARRASGPAGMVLDPAERALELAGRAQELAGEPWSQLGVPLKLARRLGATWEGQLKGLEGGRRKETERENAAFLVCAVTIGHRPLRSRCQKTRADLLNYNRE